MCDNRLQIGRGRVCQRGCKRSFQRVELKIHHGSMCAVRVPVEVPRPLLCRSIPGTTAIRRSTSCIRNRGITFLAYPQRLILMSYLVFSGVLLLLRLV